MRVPKEDGWWGTRIGSNHGGSCKAVGRKAVAVITDMSQSREEPLGIVSELEATRFFKEKGREDISHLSANWLRLCLAWWCWENDRGNPSTPGKWPSTKFEEMVCYQGGDLENLYRPVKVAYVVEIPAQDGVISSSCNGIWLYAMRLELVVQSSLMTWLWNRGLFLKRLDLFKRVKLL